MNRFESITKPLMWLMALLLAAFVAGCGGDDGTPASSAKAITAYSLAGTTGTIDEAAKTISVAKPFGTDVTALVATFTTTGASVKVAGVTQVSATTPNNFTTSKAYLVTAADGSAATYTVTVTVGAAAGPVVCTGTVADCVDLGTAANYVILDETTVTYTPIATVGPATITGDIGLSPAAASFLIGFPTSPPLDATECFSTSPQVTGKLYAADYNTLGCTTPTILGIAKDDKNFAYGFAAGKATAGGGLPVATPTECPGVGAMSDVNNALAGGGGFPATGLPAGVYTCTVAITIPGDLTLNGSATDVWVFKTTQTLEQATATSVFLTGGALPQNVFWQVAGNVLIQGTAHMEGVILTASNIQLITGATVKGRLLATSGVAMDNNTVVQPTP